MLNKDLVLRLLAIVYLFLSIQYFIQFFHPFFISTYWHLFTFILLIHAFLFLLKFHSLFFAVYLFQASKELFLSIHRDVFFLFLLFFHHNLPINLLFVLSIDLLLLFLHLLYLNEFCENLFLFSAFPMLI